MTTNIIPMPDLDEAQRFLAILDSSAKPQDWCYRAIHPTQGAKKANSLYDLQAKNLGGHGAFVVVNAGGDDAASITRIRALYVDFDVVDDHLDRLDLVPFEPSIIVESSQGKHHAYWLVDGVPLEAFTDAQRKLIVLLGSDPSIKDLPRVMRIPGYLHTKGAPYKSNIAHESGQRYTWAEFSAWLNSLPMPLQVAANDAGRGVAADPDALLAELLAGTDVHHNALRIVGRMVAQGLDDALIRLVFAAAAPAVAAQRGAERATVLMGVELSGMINGARLKGYAPPVVRQFAEISAAVEALTDASESSAIECLAAEAQARSPVERDRLLKAIKRQTGIGLGTLRQLGPAANDDDREDHLELARRVLAAVGAENILATGPFTYKWLDRGVWRVFEDRALKQSVQGTLAAHTEITANVVNNVADVFKTEIYVKDHEFNLGDPESVNCLTGELVRHDLTGAWQLQPHDKLAYRTTQIPVKYDPAANAPRFSQFLAEIFSGDQDRADKARALLEMFGYTLMSHCRHERFIMLIGGGSNGKSVLLSVLEALVGSENVAGVQPSQFDRSFSRAHLHMKLANIVTEIREGEVIADAALKGIVSGEPATVEHKFQDPFVMRPYSTCWFGTNHMPHTRDFSDALFRRALIIRFNRKFDASLGQTDPLLKEKLLAELPGILNMALTAYSEALARGFTEPESSRQAKEEWRLEADQVAQFVDDACNRVKIGKVGSQKLYDTFTIWASGQGISQKVRQKSFLERLEKLGFIRGRDNRGKHVTGLEIRIDWGDI
jgi:putative DNA primase/helicase